MKAKWDRKEWKGEEVLTRSMTKGIYSPHLLMNEKSGKNGHVAWRGVMRKVGVGGESARRGGQCNCNGFHNTKDSPFIRAVSTVRKR